MANDSKKRNNPVPAYKVVQFRNSSGFTIVELLIVIVVIAILAAIALVSFNGIARQAAESSMKSDLRNTTAQVEAWRIEGGTDTYPTSLPMPSSRSQGNILRYARKGTSYCLSVSSSKFTQTAYHFSSTDGKITDGLCTEYGTVTIVAGVAGARGYSDGTGDEARFDIPYDIALGPDGNFYIADQLNHRIRKMTPSGQVTTFAGVGPTGIGQGGFLDGSIAVARFNTPTAVAVDSNGVVYVGESGRLRKIALDGQVTTLSVCSGTGLIYGVAVDANGYIYTSSTGNRICKTSPSNTATVLAGSGASGVVDGTGTAAQFRNPSGIAVDATGAVYVADGSAANPTSHRIRKVSPSGVVTTLAGVSQAGWLDGAAASAQFSNPYDVTLDGQGNVYVADLNNSIVRKITPSGVVSSLALPEYIYSDAGVTSENTSQVRSVASDSDGVIYVLSSGYVRKLVQ